MVSEEGRRLEELAEQLAAHGYETRGVSAGGYLRPAFGFDTGFDVYVTAPHKQPDWSQAAAWVNGRRSERQDASDVRARSARGGSRADP